MKGTLAEIIKQLNTVMVKMIDEGYSESNFP
jgi:hypothetical protein